MSYIKRADGICKIGQLSLAITLVVLALPIPATCLGSYVTYYSGDDVVLSTFDEYPATSSSLHNLFYSGTGDNFDSNPNIAADLWCLQNNWSWSGYCPKSPGVLELSIINGSLSWHNWLHNTNGTLYDFSMSKAFGPLGPFFELYVPLQTVRQSNNNMTGAPPLHVCIKLYDLTGTRLFVTNVIYDFRLRNATSSFYGATSTVTLSPTSANLKLWQNATGAYFSCDNGSSIAASGKFFTFPAKVEITFHILEQNALNKKSDYEYSINIDCITMTQKSGGNIAFSGLDAGNWHFVDETGSLMASSNTGNGGAFTYPTGSNISGALIGLNDRIIYYRGEFFANSTITFIENLGIFHADQSPPKYFTQSDSCSTILGWNASNVYDASAGCFGPIATNTSIYVHAWSNLTSPIMTLPWLEKTFYIYASNLTLNASLKVSRQSGTVISSTLSSISILLANGSSITYIANIEIGNDDFISAHFFNFGKLEAITGLRFNFMANLSNQGALYFFIDNIELSWAGDSGLTISGVPANDLVSIYEGSVLRKSYNSNGTTFSVSVADMAQKFNGSIEITHRLYMRPIASYLGNMNWNERLEYIDNVLVKSNTNSSLENYNSGSECNSTNGWSFRYNLLTGGSVPSFSAESGSLIMRESRIESNGTIPVLEAYYWFDYPATITGTNITISLKSNATFQFTAGGSPICYAEISFYYVSRGMQHLINSSTRSLTPQLNLTCTISPSVITTIDKFIVEVHAYAKALHGANLYSSNDIARIDWLRINYSGVPLDYLGFQIAGLQQGKSAVIGECRYWPNSTGTAVVPLNTSNWPTAINATIFPSTQYYPEHFAPGYLYYPVIKKTHAPWSDTAFFEVCTSTYSYLVELQLISTKLFPSKTGTVCTINFSYRIFDNGIMLEDKALEICINGVKSAVAELLPFQYSTSFLLPSAYDYVLLIASDHNGIMISSKIRIAQ